MSWLSATLDRVRDVASSPLPHRPGPGQGKAAWPPRPAGRRFRSANRPWFCPGFALISVGFRPAFPLFFQPNPLKYNETAIFRRRRGPGCAHGPARPPPGMARNPGRTSCNRRLYYVDPKDQPVTTARGRPSTRGGYADDSSFPRSSWAVSANGPLRHSRNGPLRHSRESGNPFLDTQNAFFA